MFSFTNARGFQVCTAITVAIHLLTSAAADTKSGFHVFGSRFVTNDVFNSVVDPDGGVDLSLTKIGGSGFESLKGYSFGTFTMEMKLMSGYSAGVCATFFLQQGDANHRTEWDFEFLGSATNGSGINIQTNYWQNGVGAHEVRFLPAFDPSAKYHNYTVDWQKHRTQFLVDGKVVRTVGNDGGGNYPVTPFRVFGSIWNASDWATGPHTSRIPIDYIYQPWTVTFKKFIYTQATSTAVHKKIKEDGRKR